MQNAGYREVRVRLRMTTPPSSNNGQHQQRSCASDEARQQAAVQVCCPPSPGRHSDRSDWAGENRYAVYDISAPTGYKFRSYKRRTDRKKSAKDRQNIDDLEKRLNDLKLETGKNPVNKLNEMMLLMDKQIEYILVSVDGPVHIPEFTVSAKIDDIVVHGVGPSKKEAKKNAAIAFLNIMQFSNSYNNITLTTSKTVPSTKNQISNVNSHSLTECLSDINPIGILQEMCQARHWPLPSYDSDEKSNDSTYLVYCTLFHYKSEGKGKTKQSAKREAAHHMFDKIKDLSEEEIESNSFVYQKPGKFLLNSDEHDEVDRQGNSSNILKYAETFVNQLKMSSNSSINYLMSSNSIDDLSMCPIELLKLIGDEEGFRINYVLLKNIQNFGILMQVTITPIIVNVSTGITVKEAQANAAIAALLYLKLMLEK